MNIYHLDDIPEHLRFYFKPVPQIGLKDSPVKYIATMREVFAEVRRVLRNDGVMFLNMGDSYWSNPAKGGSGTFNGRNGNGEGYARALRVGAYDTSGKAPGGYQGSDCLCGSLCGACRAAYQLGKAHSGSRLVATQSASLSAPSRGCTASSPDHLPTSDSSPRVGHSEAATLDPVRTSPRVNAQPLSAPQSTKNLSSAQLRALNLQASSLGVKCLLCAQTLDAYALGFSDKRGGTQGNGDCTADNATPYEAPRKNTRYTCEYCSIADSHGSYTTACLKPKDLVGIPWMLAFALREDGWWLRQDIIWSKANPMPESVTDRCTKAHEYIFLLSKSERYYFNQEAIKTPLKDTSVARLIQDVESQESSDRVPGKTNGKMKAVKFGGNKQCPDSRLHSGKEWTPKMAGGGRSYKDGHSGYFSPDGEPLCGIMANKKSVWHVTTQGFADAHFATFPEDLIKPCILAGCPEGGTVLDPFGGSGTTAKVARELHCKAILVELNPDYIQIAARRLSQHVFNFAENRAGGVAPA